MNDNKKTMGAPPEYTPDELKTKWEDYKKSRQDNMRTETYWSDGKKHAIEVPRPLPYFIKGFCIFIGQTEQNFYKTHDKNPKLVELVTRMRMECEMSKVDAFIKEDAPSQIAGLILSKHGYTTKVEQKSEVTNTNEIKLDNILKKLDS